MNIFLLPYEIPKILACGAWLKNTVCVTQDSVAQVSALIGDLDTARTRQLLDDTVAKMCAGEIPDIVAHDLHPDFYSTQFALDFAAHHKLPTLAIQHHHAHIAAICAEHRCTETVLGLALDGVGLGTDGAPWGGELLLVTEETFQRLGYLMPLPMPGGDCAAQQPWRMAAAVLFQLDRGDEIASRFSNQPGAKMVATMLQRGFNCPATSSMGRLFDAVAGLLGACETQEFEAQAALLLQNLAQHHGQVAAMTAGYLITPDGVLDFMPLLSKLADCQDAGYGAALFHATISCGLATWLSLAADRHRVTHVALGGGCFYNEILLHSLSDRLTSQGLCVMTSQQPGDRAISLGQAWITMQHINKGI